MLPTKGATGLMLICIMYISSVEAKLLGSRGSGIEAFLSMGMETRFGHSYCRPNRPACVKLEAWVQFVRFGEVKMPMTKSWAYEITATLFHGISKLCLPDYLQNLIQWMIEQVKRCLGKAGHVYSA